MLTALSKKKEIKAAQEQLVALLSGGEELPEMTIGFQGVQFHNTIYYHKKYGLWASFFTDKDSPNLKYWFGYGLGDPRDTANRILKCEINIPVERANRIIAGAFARGEDGGVYLVHSGKIGGGRRGIGMRAFWEHYTGSPIKIVYPPDNHLHNAVQIGKLGAKNLLGLIANFVLQVATIKDIATGQQHSPQSSQKNTYSGLSSTYSPEHQGRRAPYNIKKPVEANCYHGNIVDALKAKLIDFEPVNDIKRDLYIKSSQEKIDSLFEIKPDCSWQSIYNGIGQLIVNSDSSTRNRFLVIYAPETDELAKKLETIGITVVPFVWDGEEVVFTEFGNVLNKLTQK